MIFSKITCSNGCAECDAGVFKACDDGYSMNTDKKCILIPSSEKSGLSVGLIAGIAVGGAGILVGAGWIGYIIRNRFYKSARKVTPFEAKTPSDIEAKSPISPTEKKRLMSDSEVKSLTSSINMDKQRSISNAGTKTRTSGQLMTDVEVNSLNFPENTGNKQWRSRRR